jgi:hypothetical protein
MNKECTCSIKCNIEKKAFTKTDKMENIMKKNIFVNYILFST